MKNLLIVISLLALAGVNAQELNEKGLYVDSEGSLFSGILSKTTGTTRSEFTVNQGVIAGAATYFYDSGKTMETGSFANGQKDQKWTRYNENGSVSAVAFYTLGKKTGTWLVFDEKGKKRFEMNYSAGEKTGIWTNWDESGNVVSSKDYSKIN